jgi:predicted dehydrogenase
MSPERLPLPIRAAVVGSGAISKEHLGFLSGKAAIRASTPVEHRIRLVGVCDLSPVTARYSADEYGADAPYTDLGELLAEARPDVVHVLTPPETHVALVTTCLEAGAHVICEKPITPTHRELIELLEVARANDRHLMESHNYRFNRTVVAMRRAIDGGEIGTVREVGIRVVLPVTDPAGRFGDPHLPSPIHRMPAGVVHDFITHLTYLLRHLAGPVAFDRIAAAWSNHSENPLFTWDDLDAILIGRGEAGPVHGRLRFDAGAGPDTFAIEVRGSDGWMETDLFQPYLRTVRPRPGGAQLSPIVNHVANGWGLIDQGVRNVGRKIMQRGPYEGLYRMLDETYLALGAGRPLPVTADDMLGASELIDRLVDEKVRL